MSNSNEEAEFHVTVRIRNNRLLSRRKKIGYSQANMSLAVGININSYAGLETCRDSPVSPRGGWTIAAKSIADYWEEDLEVLFPEAVLCIKTNKIERAVNRETLIALSEGAREPSLELEANVGEALGKLTARYQEIVERRLGLGEFTSPQAFADIGEALDPPISLTRVSQLFQIFESYIASQRSTERTFCTVTSLGLTCEGGYSCDLATQSAAL